MKDKAYYIILENRTLLSRKEYGHWREIQDEYYEEFKTSFPPMTCEEIINYFESDFSERSAWPFTQEELIKFFDGNEIVCYSDR